MTHKEKYDSMLNFVIGQKFEYQESNDKDSLRLDIKHLNDKCTVKIYNTGTILVQGKDSELKKQLETAKANINNGKQYKLDLIDELATYPLKLSKQNPEIDPIILDLYREAIEALRHNLIYASAFLLGAASEKAILELINSFGNAIIKDEAKKKFINRIKNKQLLKAYKDFMDSYKASKNKPTEIFDIEIKIGNMFNFYRICRNEVGHPTIQPDIDKTMMEANLSHFYKYIKNIQDLIVYFSKKGVEL